MIQAELGLFKKAAELLSRALAAHNTRHGDHNLEALLSRTALTRFTAKAASAENRLADATADRQDATEILGENNVQLIPFELRRAECLIRLCRFEEATGTMQALERLAMKISWADYGTRGSIESMRAQLATTSQQHEQALVHLENARELFIRSDGLGEVGKIMAMQQQAIIEAELWRHDRASEIMEKSTAELFHCAKGTPWVTVRSIGNQAYIHFCRGDIASVTGCLQAMRAVFGALEVDETAEYAMYCTLQGFVALQRLDLTDALQCFTNAQERKAKLFGQDHPAVLLDLLGIGHIHEIKTEFVAASTCYQTVMGSTYVRDKKIWVEAVLGLARSALAQRQKKRALELFEIVTLRSAVLPATFASEALAGRVLAMEEENLAEEIAILDESLGRLAAHVTLESSVAWAVGAVALARLLLQLGPRVKRFWEAETVLVRARNVLTRNSGVRCLFWLETFKLLALFHDAAGRPDESERELRSYIDAIDSFIRVEQPIAAQAHDMIGAFLEQKGRLEEAADSRRAYRGMLIDKFGEGSIYTTVGALKLAQVLIKVGSLTEARQVLEASLKVKESTSYFHPLEMLPEVVELADISLQCDDTTRSLEFCIRALTLQKSSMCPDEVATGGLLARIARILSSQGHINQAIQTYRDVLGMYQRNLGSLHPQTTGIMELLVILDRANRDYAAAAADMPT
jgi:tetratricopeptide (TPR) repeat protein